MHLTRVVLSLPSADDEDSLTNDCRMLIALRYRSGTIGKRSLISLLLIILDRANHRNHHPSAKDASGLADGERGEIAFAILTAKHLLKWMNMTVKDAKGFVDNLGPYYTGGHEHVEFPALERGEKDPIFLDMNDLF